MANTSSRGSKQTNGRNDAKLAVPARSDSHSPDNIAVRYTPKNNGAGEIAIAYEGPLAQHDHVHLRFGFWRDGGQPWADTSDLTLKRDSGNRYVGTVQVPQGTNLLGIEFALHANEEWDNGGRAMGYYEWRVGHERVTTA